MEQVDEASHHFGVMRKVIPILFFWLTLLVLFWSNGESYLHYLFFVITVAFGSFFTEPVLNTCPFSIKKLFYFSFPK
jgi:hypothetical protein